MMRSGVWGQANVLPLCIVVLLSCDGGVGRKGDCDDFSKH